MFWADRITRVAGVALLVLAAVVIVDAVLETVVVGDANPLARGDIEGMLRDINDNETVFYLGNAFAIVADSLAVLAVAALLYLLFRERSQALSTLFLVGLLAASVCFLVADMASITTGMLAADFVEKGGPGGIAAGDAVILQSARAVVAISVVADFVGLTVLALGLIALGTLVSSAPEAKVNPPRWLGGLAIASATAMLLTWLFVAEEDVGFAFSGIGIVGTLLFLIVLGGWLLMRPEREAGFGEARPSTV